MVNNINPGTFPAIFLDRDGVINHNRDDYVKSWEEFAFLPDALGALTRLSDSSYKVVIITNQSPIGRGLLSISQLDDIHKHMLGEIRSKGGRVDGIYFCPHLPSDGCECRKPKPGLLYQAAHDMTIDLSQSFLIGDGVSDIEAAINAGCRPLLVLTGRGRDELGRLPPKLRYSCDVFPDLSAAVDWLLDNHT